MYPLDISLCPWLRRVRAVLFGTPEHLALGHCVCYCSVQPWRSSGPLHLSRGAFATSVAAHFVEHVDKNEEVKAMFARFVSMYQEVMWKHVFGVSRLRTLMWKGSSYRSVYLGIIERFASVHVCQCLSVCLSLCISSSTSISLVQSLPVCSTLFLRLFTVCVSIYPSVHLSTSLHLWISLSFSFSVSLASALAQSLPENRVTFDMVAERR